MASLLLHPNLLDLLLLLVERLLLNHPIDPERSNQRVVVLPIIDHQQQ